MTSYLVTLPLFKFCFVGIFVLGKEIHQYQPRPSRFVYWATRLRRLGRLLQAYSVVKKVFNDLYPGPFIGFFFPECKISVERVRSGPALKLAQNIQSLDDSLHSVHITSKMAAVVSLQIFSITVPSWALSCYEVSSF